MQLGEYDYASPLRAASVKAVEEKIAAALGELIGKPIKCSIHGLDFGDGGEAEHAKMTVTVTHTPHYEPPPRPPAYDIDAHRERSIAQKEAEI